MSSSSRTVRRVSLSSPSAKATLSWSRPWPGMSTTRSRGSDMSAVAPLLGSSRTRIIVSERVGGGFLSSRPRASSTSLLRRSSPIMRIVWGLPGSTSASSSSTPGASGVLSSRMMSATVLTSSSTAVDTDAAESSVMSSAPRAKRLSMPRPRRGGWMSS